MYRQRYRARFSGGGGGWRVQDEAGSLGEDRDDKVGRGGRLQETSRRFFIVLLSMLVLTSTIIGAVYR